MWTKAEEVPKAEADKILKWWDKTSLAIQRMIVLQSMLDIAALRDEVAQLQFAINERSKADEEGPIL